MGFDFTPPTKIELLKQAGEWVERRRNSQERRTCEQALENNGLTIEDQLKAFLTYAQQQRSTQQPAALVQWIKEALDG